MDAAENVILLIRQEPMAAVLIVVVAMILAGLIKASQVFAELLMKRWLAPQPILPPKAESKTNEALTSTSVKKINQETIPQPPSQISQRFVASITAIPFVLALIFGLVASVGIAVFTGELFEGQRANGQTCQGARVFGFEIGPCRSDGTIGNLEGF